MRRSGSLRMDEAATGDQRSGRNRDHKAMNHWMFSSGLRFNCVPFNEARLATFRAWLEFQQIFAVTDDPLPRTLAHQGTLIQKRPAKPAGPVSASLSIS
jgi:hypothetical protein